VQLTGLRSGSITQTDKLFTGQQVEPNDSALGLYNYKARFYSPTLGRFLGVDPVAGSRGAPRSWNGLWEGKTRPRDVPDRR
jgi:RHS repeat-associated protein